VQLRWRKSDWGDGATAWALSMASFVRWSARVATEGDSDGDGLGNDDCDGFLLLILLSEEEGHMLRPAAAPPGAGSERETERRELWRKGESAAAGRIDRPADRSVPDEGEEDHRLDDDMARSSAVRVLFLTAFACSCRCGLRTATIYPSSCCRWLMHM
jgi:hypothetical protein